MEMHPPRFPQLYLTDPKRAAERRVYEALQASDACGMALYEARPGTNGREIDFAVWLEDIARVGLQVKGGRYHVDRGTWYLVTATGKERKNSPAKQCWESSLQLHDYLQEQLPDGRNPFTIPVLIFPEMDPDRDIEIWSVQAGVRVLFGVNDLMDRLIELISNCRVYSPPTDEEIAEEVELLIPGLGRLTPESAAPPESLELQARQVVIQHAQVVNVYTTPEGTLL